MINSDHLVISALCGARACGERYATPSAQPNRQAGHHPVNGQSILLIDVNVQINLTLN